jgi:hypothetical protein
MDLVHVANSQENIMAKAATTDSVANANRLPAFKAVLTILRVEMKKKKDRIAGINGEMADLWGRVEGHKVDKLGAKMFMMMDKLEPDERVAAMRSFDELCDLAEWPEMAADLADLAEGKEVPMRMGQSEGAKEVEKELDDEDTKPQAEKKPAKPKTMAQATEAAKRHLSVVPPPKKDGVDPDADLAGE